VTFEVFPNCDQQKIFFVPLPEITGCCFWVFLALPARGILPARYERGSDSRTRAPEPHIATKSSKKSLKGTIRAKDIVSGLLLGFPPFRLLEVLCTRQFPEDF